MSGSIYAVGIFFEYRFGRLQKRFTVFFFFHKTRSRPDEKMSVREFEIDMSKFSSSNEKLLRSFTLSFLYVLFGLLFPRTSLFSNRKTRLIEAILFEAKLLFMYKKLVSRNMRFSKTTSAKLSFDSFFEMEKNL